MEAKYGSERGGGGPVIELARMGWVFGSSSVRIGIVSLVTLDFFWVMVPESAFRGKCGAEVLLSGRSSQAYIV